ncbi:uncharacterized protein A4U43_C01F26900 [Asparagus officinalis]|uniref:Uncharacterized protein n=1 Tax=Asparagus officinalis TaxID=4686 RepID=A0A5P1FT20_ASPOF|nr:uncharacterized protein A4U43_C01F26900 [Asparagus officinalis]
MKTIIQKVIGYGYNKVEKLFYAIPGVGLDDGGLRSLSSEEAIEEMLEYARKHMAIEILVDHDIEEVELVDIFEILMLESGSEQAIEVTEEQAKTHVATENVEEPQVGDSSKATETHVDVHVDAQANVDAQVMEHIQIEGVTCHDGAHEEQGESSSSSESGDSDDEENYKIDPRDTMEDDELDDYDDELYDEFTV